MGGGGVAFRVLHQPTNWGRISIEAEEGADISEGSACFNVGDVNV